MSAITITKLRARGHRKKIGAGCSGCLRYSIWFGVKPTAVPSDEWTAVLVRAWPNEGSIVRINAKY